MSDAQPPTSSGATSASAIADREAEAAALTAARTGVALHDRATWGRLRVSGADRLSFLHNQSTNHIQRLQPGQGCDTVFVTSTARTLDLATVCALEEELWLLVSPDRAEPLMQWLDRYLFPMDRVALADATAETAALALVGPESAALLESLGAALPESLGAALADPAARDHCPLTVGGIPVRAIAGSGLALPGLVLWCDRDRASELTRLLTEGSGERRALPLGDRAWEQLRVEQGRPLPGAELTEDYNPLEAGLWRAVSFDKGCYIGQETIARLDTYQGVKQQLWGVWLDGPAEPGTMLMAGEAKAGKLTSCVETADGWRGLAYVRAKVGGAGLAVTAGDRAGELTDLPFVTRSREGN